MSGWDNLKIEFLNNTVPYLTKAQVYGYASGLQPVRAVVNLGSGVSDLLLLPVNQYQKDGRVFKG